MSLTTLLNATIKAGQRLKRFPNNETHARYHRLYRQSVTFERRLRAELRDLDDLRQIKAQ
jgi:hypothetical protein